MYLNIMIERLKQLLKKYTVTAGAAVLVVILMAYTIYNSLDLSAVRAVTTPAVISTEYEIAGLTGYIFRDEEVVYSSNAGAAVYRVGDGEKIAVGTEVARVFTYGSTEGYLKDRYELEKSISLLRRSIKAGKITASGVSETREALKNIYNGIMTSLSSGNLEGALSESDELLVYLNACDLITGSNDSLDDELAAEKSRLAALENSYTGAYDSIVNSEGGYFFYGCDGYEDVFRYDLVGTLNAKKLDELAAAKKTSAPEGRYAIGKMIYNYVWYLAVPADAGLCRKLDGKQSCSVTFTGCGLKLDLTLDRISLAEGESTGVLIFSSGVMPEGFDYARVQNIELLVGATTGYRVPDSAVHEVQGVKGVYILSASTVKFRKIKILCSGDGYYVVAERDTSAENYMEFLNLNDEIILSLSDGNLFDGRILN